MVPSLQDLVLNQTKKHVDRVLSKSIHMLNSHTVEAKMELFGKQLEASEKLKSEYQNQYEEAIDDMKKLSDHYKNRITNF